MKAVVTRVKSASVRIEGKVNGAIEQGFLVLLGVGPEDTPEICARLAEKVANVRVFSDEAGKMNLSIDQVGGAFLVVSQFTLYADLKKRRPGFSHAAKPELANVLYEQFMQELRDKGLAVEHGEFGADMQVESVNDGPVTLLFDTEEM
ncbi:MAG: D-tyrosyl-tRNA(Tyr) deacylase [Selenomonas sp.]|uniref:D-aminoacyl-tRNA deacylase n=1 Tax=Selenomonas sp. TaxID=2053611 RepID=UPI0025F496F7|nr:D-aminoacyl-tRNA deacylase [Selenomonas sp.]MCR5438342.1 D-tyrosyl-tRNA(Tyr) deacylase [Selenomonas sp.]